MACCDVVAKVMARKMQKDSINRPEPKDDDVEVYVDSIRDVAVREYEALPERKAYELMRRHSMDFCSGMEFQAMTDQEQLEQVNGLVGERWKDDCGTRIVVAASS